MNRTCVYRILGTSVTYIAYSDPIRFIGFGHSVYSPESVHHPSPHDSAVFIRGLVVPVDRPRFVRRGVRRRGYVVGQRRADDVSASRFTGRFTRTRGRDDSEIVFIVGPVARGRGANVREA